MPLTTQQIAQLVGGRLLGPPDITIDSLQELSQAGPGQLTFIGDDKYAQAWKTSKASAALVSQKLTVEPRDQTALILVENADLAMAKLLEAFAPPPPATTPGIHPTARVDTAAQGHPTARLGPVGPVGPGAQIGQGVVLHAHVTVMDESVIGDHCVLWPGVVIRERCTLGARCILHANVSIGADGFGFRPDPSGKGLVKIPQIGTVEIADDVEIGAGSCIDRGKFAATVIGEGTKIDNLVQIGHNCRIGRCCIIVAQCAIGGSVTMGDGVMMGGQSAVADHVTIGAGSKFYGCSSIIGDVPPGSTWAGLPARHALSTLREIAALRKLPDVLKELKKR